MKVKITKIGVVESPEVPTATKDGYICGEVQKTEISPFVGYTVTGTLNDTIQVGNGIKMLRDSRNGVECFGFFSTSAVKELKAKDEDGSFLFETKNSIYKFEELKD
jgi:hypothetical protein